MTSVTDESKDRHDTTNTEAEEEVEDCVWGQNVLIPIIHWLI